MDGSVNYAIGKQTKVNSSQKIILHFLGGGTNGLTCVNVQLSTSHRNISGLSWSSGGQINYHISVQA